jgi:putative DNA primase/helicase
VIATDPFAEHMSTVALALFGKPNPQHSKAGKPRWGRKGSLVIDQTRGVWFDHENQVGGGVIDLIHREKKITGPDAVKWLESIGCRIDSAAKPKPNGAKLSATARKLIESYDYLDFDGTLLLQVRRVGFLAPDGSLQINGAGKPDKTFQQGRPDLKCWVWGVRAGEYMRKGPGQDWYSFDAQRFESLPASRERKTFPAAKSVPYRLPEITEAIANGQTVFVVEGEQKADVLAKWNIAATCNAQGAGKWTGEHAAYLKDADVLILPDYDEAGRKHAGQVAQSLTGIASRIRIVELPDLPPKGDIVDWQQAGHKREELDLLVQQAPDWQPGKTPPPPNITDKPGPSLEIVRASTIEMAAYDWLWPDRFAVGKLGLIAGLPDEGKGQILCDMAARVTRGDKWPCNEGTAPQGNVVLLTAEDDPADTVVPRLAAAGANLERIFIVKMVRDGDKRRMFSLVSDLELLRQTVIEAGNVKLLQVDPFSAYLGHGKIDSFRTTDVRSVLAPVVDFAMELKVAVVGILHFNKKTDVTNALLRISDSLAFGATARHVYGVVNDAENKRKLFVRAKNNLAKAADNALAYCFSACEVGTDTKTKKPIWAPHILWQDKYVDVTAAEAMQAATETRSPVARDDAKKFLSEILAAGPVLKAEIEEAAEANGISERTLFRAKAELNITAKRDGQNGGWRWHPPKQQSSGRGWND